MTDDKARAGLSIDKLHKSILTHCCKVSVGFPMGIVVTCLMTTAAAMSQAAGMDRDSFKGIVSQVLESIVTAWDKPANDK